MLAATATLINLFIGAAALTITNHRGNSSLGFLAEQIVCEGGSGANDCDILTQAKGELTARKAVRPFFVKFHKVGGTSLMELLNAFMGVTTDCGRSCGECSCVGGAKACTGHVSRRVLVEYVEASGIQTQTQSFMQLEPASVDSQLITMEARRRLFQQLSGVPTNWIPQEHEQDNVVFITLLRNPVERIRSKYYFRQSPHNCKVDCIAKEMSFLDWMNAARDDHATCCEYVATLGKGSVEKSKKVLATLFDVVGITEEMDDVYVDAAEQFGVPAKYLPDKISCRENSVLKKDWTPEELMLAKEIVKKDSEIYFFARDLKKKRRQGRTFM